MNTLVLVMILLSTSLNSFGGMFISKFPDENLDRMQFEEISRSVEKMRAHHSPIVEKKFSKP